MTIRNNSTIDRSKLGGTKRVFLTDKDGVSLSAVITSANIHDVTVAIDTFDSIVIKIQLSSSSSSTTTSTYIKKKQNLCLDKNILFQRSRTRNHQKGIPTT
jgi:hypothetical protein